MQTTKLVYIFSSYMFDLHFPVMNKILNVEVPISLYIELALIYTNSIVSIIKQKYSFVHQLDLLSIRILIFTQLENKL